MLTSSLVAAGFGIALLIALAHTLLVLGAAWRWRVARQCPISHDPPQQVSIFKPL